MSLLKKISLIFLIIFTFNLNISFAQATSADIKCPEYNFVRTLKQIDRGQDVKLIQKILNLDYRTRIAQNGLGSKGNETELYGLATREAVKRFQALFIELIGVADGKVNARTLVVLNSVCKGSYFTNGSGSVFDSVNTKPQVATNTDKVAPSITISAPASSYIGEAYRLWVYASEPILAPTLENFILSGAATLYDIRKENPTTFKLFVKPSKSATNTVTLQIEADSISDLAGNKNTNASNEVSTLVVSEPTGPDIIRPSVTLNSATYGIFTIPLSGTVPSMSVNLISSESIVGTLNVNNLIISGPFTVSNFNKIDDKTYSFTLNTTATENASGSITLPADLFTDASGNKNTASAAMSLNVIKATVATASTCTNGATNYPDCNNYNSNNYNSGGGGNDKKEGGGFDPMQLLMMGLLGKSALEGLTGILGKNPFSSLTGGSTGGESSSAVSNALASGGKNAGGAITPSGQCVCQPSFKTVFLASTSPVPSGIYATAGLPIGPYVGAAMPAPAFCGKRFIYNSKDPCADAFGQRMGNCCGPLLDSTGKPVIGVLIKPF